MHPASVHGGETASSNGHHIDSNPVSSTPTIDVDISLDRLCLGDPCAHPTPTAFLWPHRLSASFSAMADQIAAASQALALVPPAAFSGSDLAAELGALKSRLDGIERTQAQFAAELETFKTQGAAPHVNGEEEGEGEPAVPDPAAQAAKIEELEKKLNELSETVKIDQQRLPARLHNSRATIMKATLKTPIMANGKPATGFPSSRGEFEHITKERYEALLKLYGLSVKGDTEAKREALRAFAGLPQDGQ